MFKHILKNKRYFSLFVLSSAIVNIVWIIIPYFYKEILDIISKTNIDKNLVSWDLYNLFFITLWSTLFAFIFRRVMDYAMPRAYSKIYTDLIKECFYYTQQHSYRFFSNNFVWSIIKKINKFSDWIINIFDIVVYDIIRFIISIFLILFIMMSQNRLLGTIFILWMIIFIILTFFIVRHHMKYQMIAVEQDTILSWFIADTIGNNFNISLFAWLKKEFNTLIEITKNRIKADINLWDARMLWFAILSFFNLSIEIAILFLWIKLWIEGTITPWVFVLLITYQWYITNQLFAIPHIARKIQQQVSNCIEMMEILEEPLEIKDIEWASQLIVDKWEIKFDNINFSYNDNAKVYENFNLHIKPWEKIALVGTSWSWKSTIMKLIFRFFNIQKGTILIDNQDISKVTQESLRKNISLVPQEAILFHRSIYDNIAYWNPNASKEQVYAASKAANCHEFVSWLKNWYNTLVWERWIKLSGWEKQRVAIARALLENSKILILDEATSSLDSQSELLIQQAIDKAMVWRTTIVIAHRLSTIMKMDRIVVLEKGKIIEQGTHWELISNPNWKYKQLWDIQSWWFIE